MKVKTKETIALTMIVIATIAIIMLILNKIGVIR